MTQYKGKIRDANCPTVAINSHERNGFESALTISLREKANALEKEIKTKLGESARVFIYSPLGGTYYPVKTPMLDIIDVVCAYFELTPQELFSDARDRKVTDARYIAWVMIRDIAPYISIDTIATQFNCAVGTVRLGVSKCLSIIEYDPQLYTALEICKSILFNPLNHNRYARHTQTKDNS